MAAYIVKRLIQGLIVIILVSLFVFFIMRLLPGDPLLIYVSQSVELQNYSLEKLEDLRREFGLDKPIMLQYANWIWDILHGDFGTSIFYRESVGKLMLERFPVTLHLGLLALILGAIFGILGGVLAAIRRGKWVDKFVTFLTIIGITIPVFWLGILMIYAFGLKLGWLPVYGYTSPLDDFWLSTRQIIMPVICLAVFGLASTARLTRSSMLEVIRQDYIRTAYSKGLRESAIIRRHALKNGLISVFTLFGLSVSHIFGGSVLVEMVFAIPGVGRLLVSSIFAQDYVVVQAITLVISIVVLVVNLMVDICYGWLDPRIRYG